MTKDLLETLYSKKAKDFSTSDVRYIYKLLHNKEQENQIKISFIGSPITGIGVGILLHLLFSFPLITCLSIGAWDGVILGLLFASKEKSDKYPLETLGLTKQEWKELKKSGRLKELEKMVKEYENTDYSKLGNLEEESKYIESQLKNNEKEKQQANRNQQMQEKIQSTQNNTNNSSLEK